MTVSPVPSPRTADPARPLLLTTDEALLDDVLRLAAAAGVSVDVAPDAGSARMSWPLAPLVLVGDDRVAEVRRAGLARRPAVVLLGFDDDDAAVWQRAVSIGAEDVVHLPGAEPSLVSRLADAAEAGASTAAVLAVIGGRGGAGASVLATAVALTAGHQGLRCLLLDADPWGGGIDLVLGGEDCDGLRWSDLAETRGRVSGAALRAALPVVAAISVLSWDRGQLPSVPPEALSTVLAAGRRCHDLVVVDLPRRVDAAVVEVLAQAALTVLVATGDVRCAAATSRVAAALAPHCSALGVVVRGPVQAGIDGEVLAQAIGVPLLAQMRADPRVDHALAAGRPPEVSGRAPLGEAAGRLLSQVVGIPTARRARRRRRDAA